MPECVMLSISGISLKSLQLLYCCGPLPAILVDWSQTRGLHRQGCFFWNRLAMDTHVAIW